MANTSCRIIPVVMILIASFFVFSFGCINLPGQTGSANATQNASDTYSTQLEALNSQIYSANDYSTVASLSQKVQTLESNISANGNYPNYLILTAAQGQALSLQNASILYKEIKSEIAKSGINCSKDYSSVLSLLKSMNSTKQTGITKAKSYLVINANSSASLLVTLMDGIDTEGMYLLTELLPQEKEYLCPETITPKKTYSTPLNESEAAKLVVDEVVGSEKYFVYSIGKALDAGANVSVRNPDGNITSRIMKSKIWFFMLDKTPGAMFSHDVKFVYIDVSTSEYSITNEVSNPIINGIDYWYSLDSRLNSTWIVYPKDPKFDLNLSIATIRNRPTGTIYLAGFWQVANVPAGTDCAKIDCCRGVGKDVGLVVNGNDQDLFHTDTANMYDFMKNGMGMKADDIIYLTAKAGVAESDGTASPKTFKEAIEKIANSTTCCDRVFMYITGHGINVTFYIYKDKTTGEKKLFNRAQAIAANESRYEYTGYAQFHHNVDMNPPKREAMPDGTVVDRGSPEGGDMWAADIGVLLNKIRSCNVTVMYDSCYSGFAGPWLEGKGRTVMTTSDKGSSWAYPPGDDGKSAGGIWNTLWIKAHDAYKNEADKNKDGKVDNDEAYDYANKYVNSIVKAQTGKEQIGTRKNSTSPCTCCDVLCSKGTQYHCIVVSGNGTIDPQCKKVGDYCGPLIENVTTGNITENVTGIAPVCGDNITSANEECEFDKDCPKYRYCDKKTCACKQYPLICGDGFIAAGESCDHKANVTGCSEGLECDSQCRCVQPSAICGDGKVGLGEQCDSGVACTQSGKTCNMNTCQCVNTTVVTPNVTESYCGDGSVNGNEQCESSSQCSSGYYCSSCRCVANPTYCGDKIVNGNEQCDGSNTPCGGYGVCSTGCTCVNPPSLNCDQICGYTSGAQAFQGLFTNSQQCGESVKNYFGTKTCFSTCTYSYLYTVTNIAGKATCCCGMKKEFACSDCPGQNPVCPSTSVCEANAPSWYSPPQ